MTPSGTRRGEWLELHLPDANRTEPEQWLLQQTPLTEKMLQKLKKNDGYMMKGDRLLLKLFPLESDKYKGEWSDLGILYEDDYCLVVHKPPGMSVHPASEGQTGTLAHTVAAYYENTGQSCKIRHIHRLDEDTTGPVLYAKNEFAHTILDGMMREKAIGRTYAAVVKGVFREAKGYIDAPIGKDRHHANRRRVSPGGDRAVTWYETLQTKGDASLVRLRLETGRTHQIRVHTSHLGHPIYGDSLYGGPKGRISRQALHGESLQFLHPWSGEPIAISDPFPEDMRMLIESLGLGR